MLGMSRRVAVSGLVASLVDGGLLRDLPGGAFFSAGVIARRGDGRVALRRVGGLSMHPGGRMRPFRPQHSFRVASISKMVTALGFMQLEASGLVRLDEDVSAYLGAPLRHPAFPDIPITPRMLLSHTSGLRNGADFPVPFGERLLPRLHAAAGEPLFGGWFGGERESPGEWFAYSDTNFAVLAQIMERVSGRRFDRLMSENIFAPLGLDIGYNWSGVSQRRRGRAAAGARWQDGAWGPQVDAAPPAAPEPALYRREQSPTLSASDYELGSNGFAFAPHGGLRLSLSDMDRLAAVLAHGAASILPAGALERMCTPAWARNLTQRNATDGGFYMRFGLGVHVFAGAALSAAELGDAFLGAGSAEWRGHFGDAYGWMTGLVWNARTRDSIAYALNGMPEVERPQGARSALTAPEESLIDAALSALS